MDEYSDDDGNTRDFLLWILALKPGDLIGASTGLNHVVAKIKPSLFFSKDNGRWCIDDIVVTDSKGMEHYAPDFVHNPYSRDEIIQFATQSLTCKLKKYRSFWQSVLDAEKSNPIIDSQGC